jgi:lysyl-tRNA synthetase class 1
MNYDTLAAFLYARNLVPEDMTFDQINDRAVRVRECIEKLLVDLENCDNDQTEEYIQSIFYEAGKLHFLTELRYWFKVVYQILMKQDEGPRLGQFTKLVTISFVTSKLKNHLDESWAFQQH